MSSPNHSFDINLAAKYGIEEAILIHHLQHWIRVNKRLKRNYKEGRTWTYQTRNEILANFPYLTIEKIRYAMDRLVKLKIIMIKTFNKAAMDKTRWYAFVDESLWDLETTEVQNQLDDIEEFWSDNTQENSKNVYERENSQSSGKIPTAIPDTKTTYTKNYNPKDISNTSLPHNIDVNKRLNFKFKGEGEGVEKGLLEQCRDIDPSIHDSELEQAMKIFNAKSEAKQADIVHLPSWVARVVATEREKRLAMEVRAQEQSKAASRSLSARDYWLQNMKGLPRHHKIHFSEIEDKGLLIQFKTPMGTGNASIAWESSNAIEQLRLWESRVKE